MYLDANDIVPPLADDVSRPRLVLEGRRFGATSYLSCSRCPEPFAPIDGDRSTAREVCEPDRITMAFQPGELCLV